MNLDSLKAGDSVGNSYGLDENEGEYCGPDWMYYFADGGASYNLAQTIPLGNHC